MRQLRLLLLCQPLLLFFRLFYLQPRAKTGRDALNEFLNKKTASFEEQNKEEANEIENLNEIRLSRAGNP